MLQNNASAATVQLNIFEISTEPEPPSQPAPLSQESICPESGGAVLDIECQQDLLPDCIYVLWRRFGDRYSSTGTIGYGDVVKGLMRPSDLALPHGVNPGDVAEARAAESLEIPEPDSQPKKLHMCIKTRKLLLWLEGNRDFYIDKYDFFKRRSQDGDLTEAKSRNYGLYAESMAIAAAEQEQRIKELLSQASSGKP